MVSYVRFCRTNYLLFDSEFNVLKECFKSEAEEVKTCSKKSIDFVERYALELFGEILNLMCYDYQDCEYCSQHHHISDVLSAVSDSTFPVQKSLYFIDCKH